MFDWLHRIAGSLERDQHKSDPHLHGSAALRWMRLLGHPLVMIAYCIVIGTWTMLFLAALWEMADSEAYLSTLRGIHTSSGWDVTSLAGERLWLVLLTVTFVNIVVGYAREQRRRLIAEGRLTAR